MAEPVLFPTDIGELTRSAVEASAQALAGRSVEIQARPVVVPVDKVMVERIVENLLANAARHTPAGANVWVAVRAENGGVLIEVQDDGPGVPLEMRDEIFEPFHHGPTAPSHAPGTGIGLSLVARFAEAHGGRAWVDDREGGGAAFKVFLPAGAAEGTQN